MITMTLAFAACAPVQSITDRNTRGQPPEYRAGFSDGCGSGYVAAGHPYSAFKKDAARYVADPLYKQGWDDGMIVCKGHYSSIR